MYGRNHNNIILYCYLLLLNTSIILHYESILTQFSSRQKPKNNTTISCIVHYIRPHPPRNRYSAKVRSSPVEFFTNDACALHCNNNNNIINRRRRRRRCRIRSSASADEFKELKRGKKQPYCSRWFTCGSDSVLYYIIYILCIRLYITIYIHIPCVYYIYSLIDMDPR